MARVACIDVAMGRIGGVLYSRVARTCSFSRGSDCRLVYVGQGPTYVVWSRIPSWVLIGSNRRCSSVMETQLSVHHRSNKWNLSWIWERVWYEVHDLITDHGRFICGSYEVLYVEVKNFVKELLRKRTLIIAKVIPCLPEPLFLSSISFYFWLSLVEYFCTQGSLTLVAGEAHEQICFGSCCMTVVQYDDDK